MGRCEKDMRVSVRVYSHTAAAALHDGRLSDYNRYLHVWMGRWAGPTALSGMQQTLFVPFSEVLCVSLMGSGDVHISAARFCRTGFGHELSMGGAYKRRIAWLVGSMWW